METVEAGSRQSAALPSIFNLDMEKVKREEAEYQRKHSAPAMVSPSYPYSCPPPPYQSSAANTISSVPSGLISPPESRRTSGDEKDQQRPPARQSLPSIREALNADQPLSYSGPQQTPSTSGDSYFPPPSSTSHPDPTRRAFAPEGPTQGPQNPYSQPPPRSPFMNPPQTAAQAPPLQTAQPDPLARSSFSSSQNGKLPTLHPLRTGNSPTMSTARPGFPYSYPPQQQSPAFDQGPHSAGPINQPFGYSQYPSNYPYSAPPPGNGPVYPPSAAYSAPPRYPPTWRSDGNEDRRAEESKRSGRIGGPAYGESIKRHLDNFDLEASLNEIAECSGNMLEFSRHYGQRAHQAQRTGPVPGSVPTLAEVDDLITRGIRIQESLQRMRDVVLTHQVAMEQQQDPRLKVPNGYDPDDPHSYQDDKQGAGGFAGNDPKKRRGRAAPPGRCHSCNRAETPEWRRGPDGARTLCNACGLHYAKLTRKMGTNKAAIGSSNLRPKSMGPGSPAA